MIPELEELVDSIKLLPGIGPKASTRMALYLIENPNISSKLSSLIQETSDVLGKCNQCHNISIKDELCSICKDEKRDRSRIAIVSNVTDIFAVEKSGAYDGLYYVFSSVDLLFNDKISFDKDINQLVSFISQLKEKETNVEEIIYALPYSIDAEVACSVISEELFNINDNIKASRIALGMPSGAEFDYTDKLTIIKSFKGRTDIQLN